MGVAIETGYLEFTYLDDSRYLAGRVDDALCAQVEMKINGAESLQTQTLLRINESENLGTQARLRVADTNDLNAQLKMRIAESNTLPIQTALIVSGFTQRMPSQTTLVVVPKTPLGTQISSRVNFVRSLGAQIKLKKVEVTNRLGAQIIFGTYRIRICPEGQYLQTFPYLQTAPYLAARYCADLGTQVQLQNFVNVELGTQVEQRVNTSDNLGTQSLLKIFDSKNLQAQVELRKFTIQALATQVDQRINAAENLLTQVLFRVFDEASLRTQVNFTAASKLLTQINLLIYNRTQLRILSDFPSRGTPALGGNNWTSVQAIAPGDFDVSNLNTDIVEQRTQTDGINALWQLRCDTGQSNTFVDTLAILGHNFTTSARVEIQGSDDPAFGTIKFSYVMETELENMYYIAPTLPNQPARYYQISIQDSTNTDTDGLKIGTIVFGSSLILTTREQFINPVTFGRRHFKDSLDTEGFSASSNDRALRKFLSLTFTQLLIDGGNFKTLQDYILSAKTDLKCLVIPRPTRASALAVFSKLVQLPEEQHNAVDDDNWRVDMTFEWDESL